MAVLDQLTPRGVFRFFEELCAMPHGSGNTKEISDYLVRFAAARGLEHYQDAVNNVVIIKPAAPGYENAPAVILQGHMDMVCEKAPDCAKDMAKEGLDLAVEGDTVLAKGTTLGGDDGIAVAMMLALLDDDSLPHPRLECVVTVDEETGMDGAQALDVSPLRGRTMINLDSESEGIFTVSCAGGNRTRCALPLRREPFAGTALCITVDGLLGGHSGEMIRTGRGNSSMLLGRVLWALGEAESWRLVSVEGGFMDNAIPVKSQAVVVCADAGAVEAVCERMADALQKEYAVIDPDLRVTAAPCETAALPMDADSTRRVVCLLSCAPNGVQAMSADMEGLVETSLNLGTLRTDGDTVAAVFCVRSSVESRKAMVTERLRCLTAALGGTVSVSGDYPGWAYRRTSPLRDLMSAVFTEQYGYAPKIEAIHAGLECGLFSAKLPGLDCVSLGPDMENIHTFRERLHIASTERLWTLVVEVLRRMK